MSQNNHVFESEYAQKALLKNMNYFVKKKLNYTDSLFLLHKWLSNKFYHYPDEVLPKEQFNIIFV